MEHRSEPDDGENQEIIHVDPSNPRRRRPIHDPPGYEEIDRVDRSASGVERRERSVLDQSGAEHHERLIEDHAAERRTQLLRAEQLIQLILAIIEVLIGLRVVLKLIAANPANGFAHFIYGFSTFFLGPFFDLTSSPSSGSMVLEIPSLIAIAIYAIVAWLIIKILRLIFTQSGSRSISTYDRYRS